MSQTQQTPSNLNRIIIALLGLVYLVGFGWFSFHFLYDRFYIDGSIALFNLANNGEFFMPMSRLGVAFNQLLPWLGAKAGANLHTIVSLYHVNDVLWYGLFYLLFLWLRQERFILIMVLGHLLAAKGFIFMISYEPLIVWPVVLLFYALLLSDRFKQQPVFVKFGFLFLLLVPIIWCHLLLTLAFLMIGAFVLINQTALWQHKWVKYLVFTTIALLAIRLYNLSAYDMQHLAPGDGTIGVTLLETIKYHLYYNPILFVVLWPVAGLVSLFYGKRFLNVSLLLIAFLVLVLMLLQYNLALAKLSLPFIYLLLFVIVIGWKRVPEKLSYPVTAVLFILTLFAGNEVLAYRCHINNQLARNKNIMQVADLLEPNTKYFFFTEMLPEEYQQRTDDPLGTVYEMMIQSSLREPHQTKALFIFNYQEYLNIQFDLKDEQLYMGDGNFMNIFDLNTQYFNITPGRLQEVDVPAAWVEEHLEFTSYNCN